MKSTEVFKFTKADILKKVNQRDIIEKYICKVSDGNILSPVRKDKNPGCNFRVAPSGILYLYDWSEGKAYNCFDLLMIKQNLTFYEALEKISEDFYEELIKPLNKINVQLRPTKNKSLQATPKSWSDSGLKYWSQYGITRQILQKYFVYEVKEVFIDYSSRMRSTIKNPIFAYLYPPTNKIKVYRPLTPNKKDKWKTTTSRNNIDGIHQLNPKGGSIIFITSSRKDVMTLHSLGFQAISPASEGITLTSEQLKPLLKKYRFVYTLMDSDTAGYNSAWKYFEQHGIPSLNVPITKDISDYRSRFKRRKTWKMITKLIKSSLNKRKNPF